MFLLFFHSFSFALSQATTDPWLLHVSRHLLDFYTDGIMP